MKVVAFNGSPRRNGNTAAAVGTVFERLEKQGIETEFIQLGGQVLSGCKACGQCRINRNRCCAIKDDPINDYIKKMVAADGIIIASPVYYGNVTTEVKALIDRTGFVSNSNGMLLRHKVGAAVVSARRAGSNFTYAAINYFFGINEMIIPSSDSWNMTLSWKIGDYAHDMEGIKTMQVLGDNMAWLLKKLAC